MDSECPVIENVDDNSNKEETTAINNNEVLTSQNDNESLEQNPEQEKKNLKAQPEGLKKDSVESFESSGGSEQDQETEAKPDNKQQVFSINISHLI